MTLQGSRKFLPGPGRVLEKSGHREVRRWRAGKERRVRRVVRGLEIRGLRVV
jgi:hypothetical protein